MIRSSMKQLFRKPVRVFLFLILTAAVVLFLTLGISLFTSTQESLQKIEDAFQTIGLIDQKATGVHEVPYWDGLTETYSYVSVTEYGTPIPLEAFHFDGANYIIPPQNRPFYFADSEKFPRTFGYAVDEHIVPMVEFQVREIIPGILPVRAEVTRVLSGAYKEGQEIWVCQHDNDDPVTLEMGKTYVTSPFWDGIDALQPNIHGLEGLTNLSPVTTTMPIDSRQIGGTGERLDDPQYAQGPRVYEVTDGFYETEVGRRIQLVADEGAKHAFRARILATDGLHLLLPFYEKEVYYTQGRAITQEEFDTGAAVCLLDKYHAEFNELTVGDKVDFSFVSAVYGGSLGTMFAKYIYTVDSSTLFGADGEAYEAFYEAEYEVVGIYEQLGAPERDVSNPYNLGYGTIILPSKSIRGDDGKNKNGNMNLMGCNASFQIPNGTSGAYMQKIVELGLADDVNVTFYDGGYESIKAGLMSIHDMSVVLMLSGGAATAAVLFFFAFLFVGKEKRRIAVERSLGVPKRRSAVSLLCGFMMIAVLGTAAGVAVGTQSSDFVAVQAEALAAGERFDTGYSNWTLAQETAAGDAQEDGTDAAEEKNIVIPIAVLGGVAFLSLTTASLFVSVNLKKEPMELLSTREN